MKSASSKNTSKSNNTNGEFILEYFPFENNKISKIAIAKIYSDYPRVLSLAKQLEARKQLKQLLTRSTDKHGNQVDKKLYPIEKAKS